MLASAIIALAVLMDQTAPSRTSVARGNALVARGDFDAALRAADHADAAGQRVASEEIRGAVAEARDSLREAAEHYTRALELAERAGSSPLIAQAFDDLEGLYFQQGNSDRVLELANRMLERPGDPNRALYLHRRGLAYSEMHETEAAWQALEQALPLAESTGNLKLLGEIHRDRAIWIWRYQRDRARALSEFDQALAYGRRAHAWFVVTSTLHTSGSVFRYSVGTDLPEALRRYNEALTIALREHTGAAHILKNMGDVYRQMGDTARAKVALEEAMQIADRRNVAEVRWQARNQLGTITRDSDPPRAERYFREALDLIESHQSDVLLEDFRPGVLAGAMLWANPYDEYISFLLQQHRPADAFFVAERQRARAFLETLSASREALAREVPSKYSSAERQILDRIKQAQSLLRSDTLADAKRADLVVAVGRYESELSDMRLKLAVEHPSIAHARYPKLWQLSEVQTTLLAPDESLLSFYLGRNQSVAWVVARDHVATFVLPPAKEIERAVRAALEELRNPLARERSALVALSRALSIDAIAQSARGQRLIIVPHGILYDVPFEALVDRGGHPLVERFAVSYAPSASSLAFLRSTPAKAPGPVTLLAVANPIVSGNQVAATRQVDLAHMNLLEPVPHSADEVQQIARLFGRSVRVLEGPHATGSELRRGLDQTRILHFATHGLIDETHPERSGLVLTADPPRDDGLLQARDIYSLHLSADLVTLSACETALGQNVTGEGIIGLTRAFFFAGARSVVASLWDVEDASTSRLMQRFYANIRRGQPIDIALQQAKLDFIRSGGPTSAPFYWASFVVSGNARATLDVPPSTSLPFGVASISVLLAAVFLYYLRRVNVRR
ncbi:MAG TPA: CHAT domain-containing tetratricopeptide repeat protein [Thermoanaerobaculia bacterium]